MENSYLVLALLISLVEAVFVWHRFRHQPSQTRRLFYATGSGLLTFIITTGLAQVVWDVVKRQPIGGGEATSATYTLNATTLLAGIAIIAVTAVVTTGATLAGVRMGMAASGQGAGRSQPVTLPTQVAGIPLASLRQALTERLDREELANLAFDLGIDLDSLPDSGTSGRVRELLEYVYRRGELERLVMLLKQRRPDIQL